VEQVDVVIVGGGPAGLSAALMLGRCRRRVVVIDAGEHRNRRAHAVHGYLSRDGAAPLDILRAAQSELMQYATVELLLFTDGRPLADDDRLRCERLGVTVRDERIVRLEGQDGRLERIVLADGSMVARSALFLVAGQREQSDLAKHLGCEINADGVVIADEHALTSVPGVYIAGDASTGEQLVVVAAAQGAIAATKIHASLWDEDLRALAARR